MAKKPVLRGEVGARALRVRSVSRGGALASAGVQGAWVSGCGCEADWGVLAPILALVCVIFDALVSVKEKWTEKFLELQSAWHLRRPRN